MANHRKKKSKPTCGRNEGACAESRKYGRTRRNLSRVARATGLDKQLRQPKQPCSCCAQDKGQTECL